MKDPVARKTLKIKVLSPLHIGNGERVSRRNFVVRGDRAFIVNDRLLLERVQADPRLTKAFVQFYEAQGGDLASFLEQHRILLDAIAHPLCTTGPPRGDILTFVAGADGCSYVPGSSLKGALRSVLLRHVLTTQAELRGKAERLVGDCLHELRQELRNISDQRQRKRITNEYRQQISREVEKLCFGPDQHHDLMRCIQFGDSEPFDQTTLEVAQVEVLTARAAQLVYRQPPRGGIMRLYPQVVPPGSSTTAMLTFNQYLFAQTQATEALAFHQKQNLILGFISPCNVVAKHLIEQEIAFFDRYGDSEMANWYRGLQGELKKVEPGEALLHVAWGSGFDAKTVSGVFENRVMEDLRWAFNMGKFGQNAQGKRVLVGPFPKSRKVVFRNGQRQPLGWIKLSMR